MDPMSALYEHTLDFPAQRRGQAYFNAAYDLWPHLADSVRGNPYIDPFYNDKNITAFCTFLMDNVSGE